MKAGPIGEFMALLQLAGVPEPILQYFSEIGQMEEKEIESAIEKGELPPFGAILQEAFMPQEAQGPSELEQAEVQKISAEVEKIIADMNLAKEKANTEKINQFVMMSGVQFDSEKLAIERARAIAEIDRQSKEQLRAEKDQDLRVVETADRMDREQSREEFSQAKEVDQQQFQQQHETRKQESAEKSEKERLKREDQKQKFEEKRYAQEVQTKEADQKAQGPFRGVKGVRSDNKRPGKGRRSK